MGLSRILQCAGLIVAALTLPMARGSEELTNLVYSDASRVWAAHINRLLSDPSELRVAIHDDGVDRKVVWLNYANPPRRMIRSESPRFIHVYAVNDDYAFDIAARSDQADVFWLDELGDSVPLAAPPESFDLFLPEATFMGYPLTCLVRRDLVTINSVELDRDTPSHVWIKAHVRKTVRLSEVPFVHFENQFLEGTDFEVCVSHGGDWKLISAKVTYPHGTIWNQENSTNSNGQVSLAVNAKNAGSTVRAYSSVLKQHPLRPLDDKLFYLAHYGLSESTAGFLMGSRLYILVFCSLFFGAVLFRILAYLAKRRRTKNSESVL